MKRAIVILAMATLLLAGCEEEIRSSNPPAPVGDAPVGYVWRCTFKKIAGGRGGYEWDCRWVEGK